jgi:hypothetical protein
MADDLLQRLGELEREDNADFPHEWEAVVAGTMSAEEAARLRPNAAPDEQERLAQLLTPLTDDGLDGLVDQLQAVLGGEVSAADATATETANATATPQAPTAASPPIDLAAARARRRGLFAGVGSLVAVAAALALWLRPVDPVDTGAGLALELVPYALDVRNDEVRGQRSGADDSGEHPGADAPARYRPDSTLRWVLAPDEALDLRGGDLTLGAWAAPVGGEPRPLARDRLSAHATISDAGVVELRGSFGELFDLEPGTWQLRFAIARAELGEPYAAAESAATAGDAVLVGPYVIEVVDGSSAP